MLDEDSPADKLGASELAGEVAFRSLAAIERFRRRATYQRRLRSSTHPPGQRPLAAGMWILLTVLVVVGVTMLIGWLLWRVAGQALGVAGVNARLDAARIALAAGGGAGAGIGLLLAFRRQRHHEVDATEQRITELYIKAVEHLGAAEAPVRLGALHALVRLGQENVGQRQTIVDVICAYLRMPFPAEGPRLSSETTNESEIPVWTPERWRQEREVRITAQRLLCRHLQVPRTRSSRTRFWGYINLDLNSATLFDFRLNDCLTADLSFADARFVGDSCFDGISTGSASFERAEFYGKAGYVEASFNRGARFDQASFNGWADFSGAKFDGLALFDEVAFHSRVMFNRARFGSGAGFRSAIFDGLTTFTGTAFTSAVTCFRAQASTNQYSVWPRSWYLVPGAGGRGTLQIEEEMMR